MNSAIAPISKYKIRQLFRNTLHSTPQTSFFSHVESTGKCKIRLFFWRTLLLVFQTLVFAWVYCWFSSVYSLSFYLWNHRSWLVWELLLSGKSLDAANLSFWPPLNRLIHLTSSKVSLFLFFASVFFSGQPLYTVIRFTKINRIRHTLRLSEA